MDLMELRLRQQPQYWSSDYIPERKIDCPVLPPVSRPVGWNKKHRPRRDRPNVVEGFEMISPTSAMKLENHQKNWLSSLPWSYAEAVKKPNNKLNQAVTKEDDPAEGSSESSDPENNGRDPTEINYHHNTNGNVSDSELNLNPDASEFIPGATSSEKDEMTTSATTCTTDEDNNENMSDQHGYNEENDTKRELSGQHDLIIDEESKNNETLTEINGNIHMGDAEYEYVKENAATSEKKESSPFLLTDDKTTAEDNLVYFEDEQSRQEQQNKEDNLSETEDIVEVEHNPLPDTDVTDNLIFNTIEEENIHENREDYDERKDDGLITLGNELNFEELVKNKATYSETHFENGELNRSNENIKNESNLMKNKEDQDDEDITKDIENLDTNEECTFSEDYQISEELNDIKEMLENEANRNALLNHCNKQDDDDSDLVQDDSNENRIVEETSFNESINSDVIDDRGLSEEFKLNSYENIPDENEECEKEMEVEEANYESTEVELNNEIKINENFFNEETDREDENKVLTDNPDIIIEETQSETDNCSLNDENNVVGTKSNAQLIEKNHCDTDEEKENIGFCNIPQLNNDIPDNQASKNISYDVMTTSMYESQDNDSSFEIINEPVEMKDNSEVIPTNDCEETNAVILIETPMSDQLNDQKMNETFENFAPDDDKTEDETVDFDLNSSGELLNSYVNCSDVPKDDRFSLTEENSQTETSESGVLDTNLEETTSIDRSMTGEDVEQTNVHPDVDSLVEKTLEIEQNHTTVETVEDAPEDLCALDMKQEESNIVEMSSNERTVEENKSHVTVQSIFENDEESKSHDIVPSTFENEQDNLAEEGTIHETEEAGEIFQEDELQVVPEMPTENSAEPQSVEPHLLESRLEENESNQSLSEVKEEEVREDINIENAEIILTTDKSSDQLSEENQMHQTIHEIHSTEICEEQENEGETQFIEEEAQENEKEVQETEKEAQENEKEAQFIKEEAQENEKEVQFINEEAQCIEEITPEILPEVNLSLEKFEKISETNVSSRTFEVFNDQDTSEVNTTELLPEFETSPKTDDTNLEDRILLAPETQLIKETINLQDSSPTLQFTPVEETQEAMSYDDDTSKSTELKSDETTFLEEEKDDSSLPEPKAKETEILLETLASPDEKSTDQTVFTSLADNAAETPVISELSSSDDSSEINEVKPEINDLLAQQDDSHSPELKAKELENSIESAVSDSNIMTDTTATALSAAAITSAAAIGVAVVANTTLSKKENNTVEELKKDIATDPTENISNISTKSLASEDLIDDKINQVEPVILAQPKAPTVSKTPSAVKSSAKPSTPTSKSSSKTTAVASKPSPAKTTGSAKPTPAGAKPNSTGGKPATAGSKPTAAGAKPAAAGVKPAAAGVKPAAAGVKPAAAGAKPAAAAAKPSAATAKPSIGAKPTTAAGAKPAAAKPGPAVKSPSGKPTTEVKSSAPVAKPANGKAAGATAKQPPGAATAKPAVAASSKPGAAGAKPAAAKPGTAAKPASTVKPAVTKPSTSAKPGSASGVKPPSTVSTAKPAAKSPAVAGTPKGNVKPSSPTSKPGTPTSKTPVATKPGTPPTKSTSSTPAKSTASKPGTPVKSTNTTKPPTPPTKSTVNKPTPASPKTTTQPSKKPGSPTKQSDVSSTVSRPSSASEKNSVSKTNGSAHPTKSPAPKASTPKAAPVKTTASKPGIDKTDKSKSTANKSVTKAQTPVKKTSTTADQNAKNNVKSATKDNNDTLAKNYDGECEEAVTSTTTGDLPIENGTHVEGLRPQIIV